MTQSYRIMAFIVTVFLCGCATPPPGSRVVEGSAQVPAVQQEKADVLSRVRVGMSLADFRAAIPDAYAAGQSGQTIAYELAHVQTFVTRNDMLRQNLIWGFGSPQARATKQLLWFYFYKDRLVQWGRPGDWPERPDLIIEMR